MDDSTREVLAKQRREAVTAAKATTAAATGKQSQEQAFVHQAQNALLLLKTWEKTLALQLGLCSEQQQLEQQRSEAGATAQRSACFEILNIFITSL